jgi:hypothetical protein
MDCVFLFPPGPADPRARPEADLSQPGLASPYHDLLTKTISISREQEQNLGLGPFHLLLQKFGIHFL